LFIISLNKNNKKMNIRILTIGALLVASTVMGQTAETVTMGAGYGNHIWYSFENGEVQSAPKDNWELAFQVSSYGVGIHTNRSIDMEVWKYPNTGIDDWATLDTTGMASNWSKVYNSDESWDEGALNQLPTGTYSYGWGTYNTVSHAVEGDQLFVVKLADGSFRKLWIINKIVGNYTFKLANLDNTNEIDRVFSNNGGVSDDALFGYYSISDDEFVNREPAIDTWDLVFLQYNAVTYGATSNQRVMGVLQHPELEVAKIHLDNAGDSYDSQSANYLTEINTIGYDWKELNYATFQWEIHDTLIYIVKTIEGDYWEMIFTGFSGTSTGVIEFNKQKISSAGIAESSISFVELYPNPSSGMVTLAYVAESNLQFEVINSGGQRVHSSQTEGQSGAISSVQLDLSNLEKGLYFVQITDNKGSIITKKLILN